MQADMFTQMDWNPRLNLRDPSPVGVDRMKNAVTIPMQSFGYHISGTAHAEFEHVVRLQ
jgi:hypothetical protein